MPNSAFAMPDQNRSPPLLEIGLNQRQRLVDPQPGTPEHHNQPVQAIAVPGVAGVAHHRNDFIDTQRVSRVTLTLVTRRFAGVKRLHHRRRAAPVNGINRRLDT